MMFIGIGGQDAWYKDGRRKDDDVHHALAAGWEQ